MTDMAPEARTPAERPWRDGLAAGVGSTLLAGLLVALIDASAAGFGALPTVLGLWAAPALLLGLVNGVVIAGFRATFGAGSLGAALRRLRRDGERDLALTGAVLAAAVLAVLLIVLVGMAANTLVASVERKAVGARLLGVVVVAMLPLVAMLGFPLYRATRWIARAVPPLGPVPRVVVLVAAGVLAVVALGLYVVFTQLDWQVLGVGFYGLVAGMFALSLAILALGDGPLAGLRRKIPARGIVAAVAAVATAALPVLTLSGAPARATKSAVLDHSLAGSRLVALYSKLFDRDHDGYTTFFGGPDCDDGDKDVHPGAKEIVDNGKDDDCREGDLTQAEVDAYRKAQGGGDTTAPATTDGGVAVAKPPALAEGANVLILMVDTVRADRLGVHGYQRDGASMTPRIDAFAGEGVDFSRAYSVASNTPRAMPAFMTSRYSSMIAVDNLNSNYPILDESNTMLFEVLKQAGLATFGFSSHYYFQDKRHFNQGFDDYNNDGWLEVGPANHDISAPRIVPRVTAKLEELGKSKQRFAMWVHLFDPHSTYMEHDGDVIDTHGTESLKQKYDYEIKFDDGYLGQILDTLKASGLADNTLVIVVADHGEAFGVHKFAGETMFFHGQTLYDELLRIPLVIRGPHVPAGAKVDQLVQLIDVAPTILDALGIAIPPTFQGRSLVPALRGEPLPPRPAYAELIPYPNWKHEARAMISPDGKWKLFDRISDNRIELYDLEADPEERHDVYTEQPEVAKDMEAQMAKFFELAAAAGP